ncbi:uncharacterized protein LOC123673790 [Harmonia axyridis]|uniref:uncharacterized protein LOC123673790 n=1 Tax=Harmonia axyridis TaxID=115357 RepID=UPI001E279708|nr:uncharacterized protein LOC123673790 [Harmonia axyridis]
MFRELNNRIVDKMELKLKGKFTIYQMGMMMCNENRPHKVTSEFSNSYVALHYELSKLVTQFNEVFGLNILLLIIICIIELLISCDMIPVMLAYACDCVETEASKIIPISLTYLNELPPLPKNSEEIALKEELTTLFEQSSLRPPIFTAAGFFTVNYTMLGFIIGSVTSYIIVTLQLIGD